MGFFIRQCNCTICTLIWVKSHNVKDKFTSTNKLILRESALYHLLTPESKIKWDIVTPHARGVMVFRPEGVLMMPKGQGFIDRELL